MRTSKPKTRTDWIQVGFWVAIGLLLLNLTLLWLTGQDLNCSKICQAGGAIRASRLRSLRTLRVFVIQSPCHYVKIALLCPLASILP